MHTPGPWDLWLGYDGSFSISSEDGKFVICDRGRVEHRADASTSNARLMAAAPELLEALEDMISDAEKQMANPSHHMPFSMSKAKAAVAKAKVPATDKS